MEVFRGVLVFPRIAAAHVSADQAKPLLDAGVADLDATLAPGFARVLDLDAIEMSASSAISFTFQARPGPIPPGQLRLRKCSGQIRESPLGEIWRGAHHRT